MSDASHDMTQFAHLILRAAKAIGSRLGMLAKLVGFKLGLRFF